MSNDMRVESGYYAAPASPDVEHDDRAALHTQVHPSISSLIKQVEDDLEHLSPIPAKDYLALDERAPDTRGSFGPIHWGSSPEHQKLAVSNRIKTEEALENNAVTDINHLVGTATSDSYRISSEGSNIFPLETGVYEKIHTLLQSLNSFMAKEADNAREIHMVSSFALSDAFATNWFEGFNNGTASSPNNAYISAIHNDPSSRAFESSTIQNVFDDRTTPRGPDHIYQNYPINANQEAALSEDVSKCEQKIKADIIAGNNLTSQSLTSPDRIANSVDLARDINTILSLRNKLLVHDQRVRQSAVLFGQSRDIAIKVLHWVDPELDKIPVALENQAYALLQNQGEKLK